LKKKHLNEEISKLFEAEGESFDDTDPSVNAPVRLYTYFTKDEPKNGLLFVFFYSFFDKRDGRKCLLFMKVVLLNEAGK
jgi:hypothetical protein